MRVSFLFRLIFDTHILNGKLSLFRVNCQIKSDLLQITLDTVLNTNYACSFKRLINWAFAGGKAPSSKSDCAIQKPSCPSLP